MNGNIESNHVAVKRWASSVLAGVTIIFVVWLVSATIKNASDIALLKAEFNGLNQRFDHR